MAQDVRGKSVTQTDPVAVPAHDSPRSLPAEAPAAGIEEQRLGVPTTGPALGFHIGSTTGSEPVLQCSGRAAPEWDQPFLRPLAEGTDQPVDEIDVGQGKPDELRDAQPGAVQHLED